MKTGVEDGPESVAQALGECLVSESGTQSALDAAEIPLPPDAQAALAAIEATLANAGKFVALGGDHGLTYAAFKALAARVPGAGLISLSARPDCVRPLGIAAREDWLRALVQEFVLPSDRTLLVGTRSAGAEERDWLRRHRIRLVEMKHLAQNPIDACDDIMEAARSWPACYLSIDIDILDPAFAPGTAIPEPGGLSTRELLGMVQRLKMLPNLAGVDIVEVNPAKDPQGLTQKIAAKVLAELLA
jgi:agmatinase